MHGDRTFPCGTSGPERQEVRNSSGSHGTYPRTAAKKDPDSPFPPRTHLLMRFRMALGKEFIACQGPREAGAQRS